MSRRRWRITFGETTQQFLPLLNDAPKGATNNSFLAPEGAYQLVAKTVERPQLSLLTSIQPRLSTKGASWLRLLCACGRQPLFVSNSPIEQLLPPLLQLLREGTAYEEKQFHSIAFKGRG